MAWGPQTCGYIGLKIYCRAVLSNFNVLTNHLEMLLKYLEPTSVSDILDME